MRLWPSMMANRLLTAPNFTSFCCRNECLFYHTSILLVRWLFTRTMKVLPLCGLISTVVFQFLKYYALLLFQPLIVDNIVRHSTCFALSEIVCFEQRRNFLCPLQKILYCWSTIRPLLSHPFIVMTSFVPLCSLNRHSILEIQPFLSAKKSFT